MSGPLCPRRYWVTLAACAVAAGAAGPLIGARPRAVAAAPPGAAALAPTSASSPDVRPATARPPLVVELRTETWSRYIDLAIRVLAVVLAWLTGQPRKTPTPPGTRRAH